MKDKTTEKIKLIVMTVISVLIIILVVLYFATDIFKNNIVETTQTVVDTPPVYVPSEQNNVGTELPPLVKEFKSLVTTENGSDYIRLDDTILSNMLANQHRLPFLICAGGHSYKVSNIDARLFGSNADETGHVIITTPLKTNISTDTPITVGECPMNPWKERVDVITAADDQAVVVSLSPGESVRYTDNYFFISNADYNKLKDLYTKVKIGSYEFFVVFHKDNYGRNVNAVYTTPSMRTYSRSVKTGEVLTFIN